MIKQFVLLLVSCVCYASAYSWGDHFGEQTVFTGRYCDDRLTADLFTVDGVYYRMNATDGSLVLVGDEDGQTVLQGESLDECAYRCSKYSHCVAFSYNRKNAECKMMSHCKITTSALSRYTRVFTKHTFGCHRPVDAQPGFTCSGTSFNSMVFEDFTTVEECMEAAKEVDLNHFTLNGDGYCSLWSDCEGGIVGERSSAYYKID